MKKALIGLFAVIALLVSGVVVAALMQPDETHVERSRVVAAKPADIVTHLDDLEQWTKWSPWSDLDPNQTLVFSDPPRGQGAWYTWEGNDEVGKGRMEIASAKPDAVHYKLEFIEPFESKADVTMSLAPDAAGTKVTWAMDSENGFGSKMAMVFMDFDAMVGADFEKGLNRLAERVESTDG